MGNKIDFVTKYWTDLLHSWLKFVSDFVNRPFNTISNHYFEECSNEKRCAWFFHRVHMNDFFCVLQFSRLGLVIRTVIISTFISYYQICVWVIESDNEKIVNDLTNETRYRIFNYFSHAGFELVPNTQHDWKYGLSWRHLFILIIFQINVFNCLHGN